MQHGYGQDMDLTYSHPDYGYYWGEILYKLYRRLVLSSVYQQEHYYLQK